MSDIKAYLDRCVKTPFFAPSLTFTREAVEDGEVIVPRLSESPPVATYLRRLTQEAVGIPLDEGWLQHLYRQFPSALLDHHDDDDDDDDDDLDAHQSHDGAQTFVQREAFGAAIRIALRGFTELQVLDGARGHQADGNTAVKHLTKHFSAFVREFKTCPMAVVAQLSHYGHDAAETFEAVVRLARSLDALPRSRGGRPTTSARTWLLRRLAVLWNRAVVSVLETDATVFLPGCDDDLNGAEDPSMWDLEPAPLRECAEACYPLITQRLVEMLENDRVVFVYEVVKLVEDMSASEVRQELGRIQQVEGLQPLWIEDLEPFDFYELFVAPDSPYARPGTSTQGDSDASSETLPAIVSRFDANVLDDAFWEAALALLPPTNQGQGGRPRADPRAAMAAVIERELTGCTWEAVSSERLSASKLSAYASRWRRPRGRSILDALLELYSQHQGRRETT